MAAPNRVRRGGRRAPAGSSLLTRPASPCPTRTVAMGKDSSRGVTIHRRRGRAIGRSERPGRGGGGPSRGRHGNARARPASLRPARPGAWLLEAPGRAGGRVVRPGTEMACTVSRVAHGRLGTGSGAVPGPGSAPRGGLRCRLGTPRDAGPALGTAGERGCRLLLRPLLHSRPP